MAPSIPPLPTDLPSRRPLKVFAIDPMLGREPGNRITVDVKNETLMPGPVGERLEVIDYDGVHKRFYTPVDLDERGILMQSGLDPSESDPRFHQQMVYAVAMRTLECFDRALGRKVSLRSGGHSRLRLFPHAFYGANAFYDRDLHGICFGYFKADQNDPGRNLPGQTVFTCLAYDVVAHEMTHAVVDRLRRYFLEPSNVDVLAFHEGFADIVALFQRFSYQQLLSNQIQKVRGDLREKNAMVQLAQQFGQATGRGTELRSALDVPANPALYRTSTEPHERGAILVSAVFDAFFTTYQRRIADLIRIATGGTGILPDGNLLPDLANRFAHEALRSSQSTLTMCIRAFDYLPPVDISFGDYLRGLVTADFELSSEDEFGTRGAMIEAFRARGIYPEGVISLAEESLLWSAPESSIYLPMEVAGMLQELMDAANRFSRSNRPSASESLTGDRNDADVKGLVAKKLVVWAKNNRTRLMLHADLDIAVHGFYPAFRVSASGELLTELVAQFVQTRKGTEKERGGIPLRGGTTIVASADGNVKYLIARPLPSAKLSPEEGEKAKLRLQRQEKFLAQADGADPTMNLLSPGELNKRMLMRGNLATLHLG